MSEHAEVWRQGAACAGAPDPDRFVSPSTPSRDAQLLAVEFCAVCPVARPCRGYARATRSQGVWGGVWFPTPGTGQAVSLVADGDRHPHQASQVWGRGPRGTDAGRRP